MADITDVKEIFLSAKSPKVLSTEVYLDTVKGVVQQTTEHLNSQNSAKKDLRTNFTRFFKWFIFMQFIVLIVLIVLNASIPNFIVSEAVLLAYISSVFVETLGVMAIMVTFAYNNKTEKTVLEILKSIVENFKIQ